LLVVRGVERRGKERRVVAVNSLDDGAAASGGGGVQQVAGSTRAARPQQIERVDLTVCRSEPERRRSSVLGGRERGAQLAKRVDGGDCAVMRRQVNRRQVARHATRRRRAGAVEARAGRQRGVNGRGVVGDGGGVELALALNCTVFVGSARCSCQ
jgi:hypothetical protein